MINYLILKAADLMTTKPSIGEKDMLVGEALNIMNNKKLLVYSYVKRINLLGLFMFMIY